MVDLTVPFAGLNTKLPNRLVKAAMSERLARADGSPSAALIELYRRWANSGAGLLITGNVMIDASALGEPGNVVVESERGLSSLGAWAKVARAGGAAAYAQLNHPGRQAPRAAA